uniref:ABC transporter domain-containing protein n=1 Tax=Odontella aurita TaxID=265563 RepID=A0A7S4JUM9_9STRA|mmetsp:Transcript_54489/g.162824  ORF Transcript_54489/g.162824 Transcript_54489/m.162824 type:complete len:1553 (+) Transcript_54489:290-4948(+)
MTSDEDVEAGLNAGETEEEDLTAPESSLEIVQQDGYDEAINKSILKDTPQGMVDQRNSADDVSVAHHVSFGSSLSDRDISSKSSALASNTSSQMSRSLPPRGIIRQKSVRTGKGDHVEMMARRRRASLVFIEAELGLQKGQLAHSPDSLSQEDSVEALRVSSLGEKEKKKLMAETKLIKKYIDLRKELAEKGIVTHEEARSVEVRIKGLNYIVPVIDEEDAVHEVVSSAKVLKVYKNVRQVRVKKDNDTGMLRVSRRFSAGHIQKATERCVLNDIDLVLRPGHTYLVLGPPGSGKTTLLRAISSLLPTWKHGPKLEGSVLYNGIPFENDRGVVMSNAISFVDQIDRHAPRLSVKETFNFTYQCKGGTHGSPLWEGDPEKIKEEIARQDKEDFSLNFCMEGLGLSHVQDTFVGNTEVRGVSGGQRRRVTLGEMLMWVSPVLCGDEISTGLDAASTYDIMNTLCQMSKMQNFTRIISLLQPSPETFSLFDEVIIMSEGHVIYAGPILDAVPYFHGLGYDVPDHMDDADFLQALATSDGKDFYNGPGSCPDAMILAIKFKESVHGGKIRKRLGSMLHYDWTDGAIACTTRRGDDLAPSSHHYACTTETSEKGVKLYDRYYEVSFWRATILNSHRFFTLWKRDKRFVRANFIKNVVMGISVGLVFLQTKVVESILGVLFQTTLFIMLGAMTAAPAEVNDRAIYYKHQDANLFPTFSYVLGRTFSLIPQTFMDISIFGTIIYFVVGLELKASNFFIFYFILIVFQLVMNTMLSACAAVAPSSSAVQAMSAVIILFNMLFCGFFVAPNTIPDYYIWIYWMCPLAWAYRALTCNQFLGDSYSKLVPGTGMTQGENILMNIGFEANGEPFAKEWIGYSFAYMIPYCILMMCLSAIALRYLRYESGKSAGGNKDADQADKDDSMENEDFDLNFKPIDLTFKDICYEVNASTGDEKLKLLNEVNGRLQPGRMCALMGSSGAGKTTLMDVIALRKTSGTITGEVRLNGHFQEEATFRRCSGYVEQFDVQTPELTVKESILFSANLRLDTRNDPLLQEKDNVLKFVDQVIDMMELRSLENTLVGDDESGGLSFEQKKRLSIAVELASSPSVIFLDEPTSGLDSRAALIVVKSLRKIASTGRTVCATIHQPSSAVFEMFDDLLLMKKGGRVVYCGELGKSSTKLCNYLESHGGAPMNRGENPATWMLNVITKEPVGDEEPMDYAQIYVESDERKNLGDAIDEVTSNVREEDKITFENRFAASAFTRHRLMTKRLRLVYWRSPSYNRSRIVLSLLIAFLLASVFLSNRRPAMMSEQEISGVFSTIFLSFIIVGILSLTSVLPVMLKIRDVFYRHRAAGMMNHWSLTLALAFAEQPFILISGTCFCAVFYFAIGLAVDIRKFIGFWGFFTFNVGINSYFGQSFMCLVRGLTTAGILCSVLIGMNNFFSGLIVRPQYLSGFWQAPYWITPGRYVYEGMMASQFYDDERNVTASPGSSFWQELDCDNTTAWPEDGEPCYGTVADYFNVFFGYKFKRSNIPLNGGILAVFLIIARALTGFALWKLNYTSS